MYQRKKREKKYLRLLECLTDFDSVLFICNGNNFFIDKLCLSLNCEGKCISKSSNSCSFSVSDDVLLGLS